MVKRVLVTTAKEETWPTSGEPILFLGEWCRLYGRKDRWEQLNAEVAPYHWDDRNKLHEDYRYLNELYERLLTDLAVKLNQIHGVNHSHRYWRILIGPWLGFFTQALFDRWFMLKRVVEQGDIFSCNVIERDDLAMIPNDMEEFCKLFVNDDWNEYLYGQLLIKECVTHGIHIQQVKKCSTPKAEQKTLKTKLSLKNCAGALINSVNGYLTRADDHFFLASYLPLRTELLLQLRLGQFPKRWCSSPLPRFRPVASQRAWSLSCKREMDEGAFEAVARKMIQNHIPVAYLEGYKHLTVLACYLPWPKKPKSIFTSNSFESNDLFKAWAAEKTQAGVPLLIGQHGGHFGMSPFAFHEEHQIKIADKWLSWGWADPQRPKIIPVGNLKAFGRNAAYDPTGGALMVGMALPRYSYHLYAVPVSRQQLDYFDDQKCFLSYLPAEIRKQVTLRLYMHDYGWGQAQRWQDEDLGVQIDDGSAKITSLIAKCRIYIATYNATTYLESLTWNVPTLIFWNPEHWELNDDAQPYLEILESVGVFHPTPESAAKKLIAIWDNVEGWWQSPQVQDAMYKFCDQYAKRPEGFLDSIKNSLVTL